MPFAYAYEIDRVHAVPFNWADKQAVDDERELSFELEEFEGQPHSFTSTPSMNQRCSCQMQ